MNLLNKIENRSARVGVIGLGYVGLPLTMEFVKAGFNVTGFDISVEKVALLNEGNNYIADVNDSELKNAVENNLFNATDDFSKIAEMDTISICVPTPLNKLKNPDMSYVISAVKEIEKLVHKDMLIVLESTTYPGSTQELVLPALSSSGLEVGKDFFLCFSPERIDPGNQQFQTHNTPKVLGGTTPECIQAGKLLYESIVNEIVPVSSTAAAEMTKLLENTFRAINIGLANEVAIMCEKLGIDAWEVIEAASTKPFGFMKFTPGPGLGGHCIPVDPHYLSWKLKALDYDARFIELAGEINTNMPNHVVNIISDGLNEHQKALNGSQILILGVAYKKNVNDVRESPSLDVINLLNEHGAEIDFYDPWVPSIKLFNSTITGIESLSSAILDSYDAVAILTDHSDVDYQLVKDSSKLIIDTRNVYPANGDEHIVKLGVG
ncbi:MAG: nucleotide sugar dehydrogenase [Candidatus Marinimicrobia bacterium]|mgnify:CR=1 FL=1|jgi:UDP-N-acetyl-D-glucosamine dehydrogenase|nr:nucleotide sugar dehydrogenase [Candidatus Neomarinimicrobiota bacterium]MBT3936136.1 nucleotide sugar dehydrogenase [Candidatus Neomarinimicrobiota bacterium]MBT3961107.1 nucleotide sugar dehydrogenase [Candidatus Neomarinimicrobiota bacterium]MBT4686102.1 nucleotide sugar dehydrogenase [Candidatus Neomarinimicrobiota bacterium]MBT4734232.1 nucleotide sugar dehydrogenase [Candidatus Neomarinimicrobiota bacterium]